MCHGVHEGDETLTESLLLCFNTIRHRPVPEQQLYGTCCIHLLHACKIAANVTKKWAPGDMHEPLVLHAASCSADIVWVGMRQRGEHVMTVPC